MTLVRLDFWCDVGRDGCKWQNSDFIRSLFAKAAPSILAFSVGCEVSVSLNSDGNSWPNWVSRAIAASWSRSFRAEGELPPPQTFHTKSTKLFSRALRLLFPLKLSYCSYRRRVETVLFWYPFKVHDRGVEITQPSAKLFPNPVKIRCLLEKTISLFNHPRWLTRMGRRNSISRCLFSGSSWDLTMTSKSLTHSMVNRRSISFATTLLASSSRYSMTLGERLWMYTDATSWSSWAKMECNVRTHLIARGVDSANL